MIINVDRKTRSIQLSIKAKDNADQQEAMQRLSQTSERENAGTTSLGALLRAKLDNQNERRRGEQGSASASRPHDALRPRRPAGRALRPADPPRHRVRGQDDPRRDGDRAGARAPHRDPRLRQLLDQPAAAARRAQPALRRAGRHPREAACRTSSRARRCAKPSTQRDRRDARRGPTPMPTSAARRAQAPEHIGLRDVERSADESMRHVPRLAASGPPSSSPCSLSR